MIKPLLILILLFCFQIFGFGQTNDPIAAKRFRIENHVDSQGQKQGPWIYYRMFFNSMCSALSTSISDTCYRKISKGQYQDNKKIGTWE